MIWREWEHPRWPKGHPKGGQFVKAIRAAREASGVKPDKTLVANFMLVRQGNKNDCGFAAVLGVAKYYNIDFRYKDSSEFHSDAKGGRDVMVYPWELQPFLEELGIEAEFSGTRGDFKDAYEGKYPMVFLAEEKAHYVILWNGLIIDSLNGVREIGWMEFLDEYLPGGGFKITSVDESKQRHYKLGVEDIR